MRLSRSDKPLTGRQGGHATRVAALIALRLAVLREQGTSVSVMIYEQADKAAIDLPIEVSLSRAFREGSRQDRTNVDLYSKRLSPGYRLACACDAILLPASFALWHNSNCSATATCSGKSATVQNYSHPP